MKANNNFLKMPRAFWSYVRIISQEVGYTDRRTKQVIVPDWSSIQRSFDKLGLSIADLVDGAQTPTCLGQKLQEYFVFRADVLNGFVSQHLMDKNQAEQLFTQLYALLNPQCPLPKNKQKGDKKNYAFFTCIVNMLIEHNLNGLPCDYDPRSLITVTRNSFPLTTLSRRVDGAFPSVFNPIAIWEIKEYYYTTTFGSRVADAVYESQLDGFEINELRAVEDIGISHLLFVDGYFTWWECGRSYLCRIIDMLHMGFLDEVIFGREIVDRLPQLVKQWVENYHQGRYFNQGT